jgi:hypothetical protein
MERIPHPSYLRRRVQRHEADRLRTDLAVSQSSLGTLGESMNVGVRRPSLFALCLCVFAWCSALAQTPTGSATYIFLIDTSASMVGQAGHANIFPRVKSAIADFVRRVPQGSTVNILTFSGTVETNRTFPISESASKDEVIEYVNSLAATGQRTGVVNAIATALNELQQKRQSTGSSEPVVFFVYTDGDDNASSGWTLNRILNEFDLKRGSQDWLFFTELGLSPDPRKVEAFRNHPWTKYVQEAAGSVHPILVVRPALEFLDFGNVKVKRTSERVQRFDVVGADGLPADAEIAVEPQFETVQKLGVLPTITPARVARTGDVPLALRLVNTDSLPDGTYDGTLALRSSDPMVLIVPPAVRVRFTYADQAEISVQVDGAVLNFGSAQRGTASAGVAIERRVKIVANNPARSATVGVEITQGGEAGIVDVTKRVHVVSVDEAIKSGELVIRLTPDPDWAAGDYAGDLWVTSPDVMFDGPTGTKSATRIAIPWAFTMQRARIPLWVWAALAACVAAAIFFGARRFTAPPVFSDLSLDVSGPERRRIDLAGQRSCVLGTGGTDLTAWPGRLSLEARRDGKSMQAWAKLHAGDATLRRRGQAVESHLIADEQVFDGDTIQCGNWTLRISSFDLVPDDRETV